MRPQLDDLWKTIPFRAAPRHGECDDVGQPRQASQTSPSPAYPSIHPSIPLLLELLPPIALSRDISRPPLVLLHAQAVCTYAGNAPPVARIPGLRMEVVYEIADAASRLLRRNVHRDEVGE